MKKKKLVLINLAVCIGLVVLSFINISCAGVSEIYQPRDGRYKIVKAILIVANWIKYASLVLGVGVLMTKGIKYITAAPEGKAEVKKEFIPWAVGMLITFVGISVIQTVVNFAQDDVNNITY